jgi:hypothetical protein
MRRFGFEPSPSSPVEPATKEATPTAQAPPDWKFVLKFQRGEAIYDPSDDQLAKGIRSLRVVEGDSYCFLERRDGDYVQTICGVNGFHVEWRVFHGGDGNKFDHFKAGYPETSNRKERCQKAVYGVPGFENELLHRSDANSIFLAFIHSGKRPEQFVWRRMSDDELH